jgi:F-type H+-transporting ATPase subunit gamma
MPQISRDIQRRLKSVHNIKKITRAMELVAASKMRKSVERVLASRPYAQAAWQIVMDLVPRVSADHHALLQERPVKKVAIVVLSSNRGLCGAFNMNIVNKSEELIKKEGWGKGVKLDYITSGKMGGQILSTMKKNIVADYAKGDITKSVGEIVPLASEMISGFLDNKYDEICLAYMDFYSSLKQVAHVRHILPLVKPSRFLGQVGKEIKAKEKSAAISQFIFEPDRHALLEQMLPRMIELQVYQAVLETEASEHSARMLAMHNATDAASDMIESLALAYNQARQAGITAELAEIATASLAI